MTSEPRIRAARADDAAQMARVHVESWRETYRGAMTDEILDAPDLLATRERFWRAALTDPRWAANRAAVAESGDRIVGIAMSGPAEDTASRQLFALYVLAAHHGTGVGTTLLEAVIDPADAAVLWVLDPHPRAQGFYRRRGFTPDGASRIDSGVRTIRMVRTPRHPAGTNTTPQERSPG